MLCKKETLLDDWIDTKYSMRDHILGLMLLGIAIIDWVYTYNNGMTMWLNISNFTFSRFESTFFTGLGFWLMLMCGMINSYFIGPSYVLFIVLKSFRGIKGKK